MNDFESLTRDYGFKPQGKSAPMAASKSSSNISSSNNDIFADLGTFGSGSGSRSNAPRPQKFDDLGDIFGGSARYTAKSGADSSLNLDSMFAGPSDSGAKHSSLPIFDKPVYDDDIFEGVPGIKSSSGGKYDDVFSTDSSKKDDGFDDLLGGFVKAEAESKKGSGNGKKNVPDFDDLIPGFGRRSPPSERLNSEASRPAEPATSSQRTSSAMEDPFAVFESSTPAVNSSSGLFTDPLDEIGKLNKSSSTKYDDISAQTKKAYDDVDPFDSLSRNIPNLSSENNNRGKEKSPLRTESRKSPTHAFPSSESDEKAPVKGHDSQFKKNIHTDSDLDSHGTFFGMPSVSTDSYKSFGQSVSPPSRGSATANGANMHVNMTPRSEEKESSDDIWLTASEIPLFTQPTSAPPPSRPPPPIPIRKKVNEFSKPAQSFQSPQSASFSARGSVTSSIDEFEDFGMGSRQGAAGEYGNSLGSDDADVNSVAAASAAAMKEAMDKAEAKFRHARGVRERENSKAFRSRETVNLEKDEKSMPNVQERAYREKQERLDREQMQREREEEEKEKEQMRIEREREEKEREQRRLEREREIARQAVERATREARERAAAEARLKAERAAVEKAAVEARERAERAAVQRAQAEARERAAAEAKEKAERAAAEAREKVAAAREKEKAEARARAERAAVERAAAEARERAAAVARERAAAAAKTNQQKNDDDLESFFSMGRASSAPRSRTTSSDPFETQFQSRQGPAPAKASAGNSANIRKASSTTNIVDDLSSIFGAAPSAGEFQEIDGESEERRRARLERHQRTQERAAKALAEKNERDLQAQKEQAERHRIAETLDVEIRRWAAGKEGNLRALLSTLQYVLWPECSWQPVSLTDLITAAAVKKAYRKATLCIHPDKVQQKGANLQQKYVAEKVFDLLKEAWNKFNSEELF